MIDQIVNEAAGMAASQPPLTPAEIADGNAANLTVKFETAIEVVLDSGVQLDPEKGTVSGVSFSDGALKTLKTLTEAFRDYQTGEAARRTSIRTPMPAQVQLPGGTIRRPKHN